MSVYGVYVAMENSPIADNLLEFLGGEPRKRPMNPTTLVRQGQIAQEWLLRTYLGAWLELIGSLVDCHYPLALAHAGMFKALAREGKRIDPHLSATDQIFFLGNVQATLQRAARCCGGADERAMQWGIWARDVPMAIAYGFEEAEVLNPVICEGIAPVCMYAAFLVGIVVTDSGVAQEISAQMFEELPRQLLELLERTPVAPEA